MYTEEMLLKLAEKKKKQKHKNTISHFTRNVTKNKAVLEGDKI